MMEFVAFLRGINVGGHRKVPMAELRDLLKANGFQDVRTYIQTGNVLFESNSCPNEIELKIEELILQHFGFKVDVVVKPGAALKSILEDCPFTASQLNQTYFILFKKQPQASNINKVSGIQFPHDQFEIKGDVLYLYCEKGYGKTKFNLKQFESKLETSGTARNYKTMLKLLSLQLK